MQNLAGRTQGPGLLCRALGIESVAVTVDGDVVATGRVGSQATLGGATLDNEENYLIKKLFTAGLGMVCISNQARI